MLFELDRLTIGKYTVQYETELPITAEATFLNKEAAQQRTLDSMHILGGKWLGDEADLIT